MIEPTTDSVNGSVAEVKNAFEMVEKLGVDWDNKLRRNLDEMIARLEEKHAETRALIDPAATGCTPVEHASPGR